MGILISFLQVLFRIFVSWFPALLVTVISRLLPWILGLTSVFLLALLPIGKDIALWVFDGLLTVTDYIVSLIGIPDVLKSVSLQGLFDGLGGQLLGLFGYVKIPQAMALLAAAFTVRLIRDIVRR